MVPANHLDGDAVAIEESNYMTNILPQVNECLTLTAILSQHHHHLTMVSPVRNRRWPNPNPNPNPN